MGNAGMDCVSGWSKWQVRGLDERVIDATGCDEFSHGTMLILWARYPNSSSSRHSMFLMRQPEQGRAASHYSKCVIIKHEKGNAILGSLGTSTIAYRQHIPSCAETYTVCIGGPEGACPKAQPLFLFSYLVESFEQRPGDVFRM